MKTKKLVELVKQGARPIVRVLDRENILEGPDPGMLGRIVGVDNIEKWGRGDSDAPFIVDFFEFTEYNRPLMVANWYDKDHNPVLRWDECSGYERDAKAHTIHEMYTQNFEYSDLNLLELVKENRLLNQYIESGSSAPYVEWLESKLINLENLNS